IGAAAGRRRGARRVRRARARRSVSGAGLHIPRPSRSHPKLRSDCMHPWHDVEVEEETLERSFPVIVEVPTGSKNKYELDKQTGLLRLDRVLFGAVHYPANHGFVPRTLCDDEDPLDALVLGQEPVLPLTIVEARAVGVMQMRDEKGRDDKLVAVSIND